MKNHFESSSRREKRVTKITRQSLKHRMYVVAHAQKYVRDQLRQVRRPTFTARYYITPTTKNTPHDPVQRKTNTLTYTTNEQFMIHEKN